jgi:hypothetical protein
MRVYQSKIYKRIHQQENSKFNKASILKILLLCHNLQIIWQKADKVRKLKVFRIKSKREITASSLGLILEKV